MSNYQVERLNLHAWKLEINHGNQKSIYLTREQADRRLAELKSQWHGAEFRVVEVGPDLEHEAKKQYFERQRSERDEHNYKFSR